MTIETAIGRVDELKANTCPEREKILWLSELELMIRHEVLDTHEDSPAPEFAGYSEDTELTTELLLPAPYDRLYLRWLEAQIDYANGEYGRYNNSIQMFNAEYLAFQSWWNRTHKPVSAGRFLF